MKSVALIVFACFLSGTLHSEPSRQEEILKQIDLENSILEHEYNLGRMNTPRTAVKCIVDEGISPRYPSYEAARSRCIENSQQIAQESEAKDIADRAVRTNIIQEWTNAYMRCALSLVRAVDDGFSDAQTVALGLHSKCRNVSPTLDSVMNLDRAEDLARTLRPKLVEIVLTRRAAQRK